MKKSWIVYLLLAVMVLGMLAPAAYATETTEAAEETEETEETVAQTREDLTAASGKCGDNLTWTFEDGTLTVSGKGEMESGAPWGRYRDDIRKLVLTGGVTTVSEEAFKDCDALTEIDFGESLKEIGVQAFMSCDGLESIRLPQTFRLFAAECFRDCSNLTEIYCAGTMPSFKSNCLWNANTITIYTPMNNPWPQEYVDQLAGNFGGRLQFIPTGGENLYNYHPTEPETEPTTVPTTEPVTEPTVEATTEPVTEPTTEPETVPTTQAPTEPETVPTTQAPETEPTQPHVPGGNLNSRSWIGLVLIIGVLTLLLIGALLVRGNSRKGGRYTE